MSVTVSMKVWRPWFGSARRVLPGMTSFQRVFQTERPMRRAFVKPGPLEKFVPSGTARKAWCLLTVKAGSLSESLEMKLRFVANHWRRDAEDMQAHWLARRRESAAIAREQHHIAGAAADTCGGIAIFHLRNRCRADGHVARPIDDVAADLRGIFLVSLDRRFQPGDGRVPIRLRGVVSRAECFGRREIRRAHDV